MTIKRTVTVDADVLTSLLISATTHTLREHSHFHHITDKAAGQIVARVAHGLAAHGAVTTTTKQERAL